MEAVKKGVLAKKLSASHYKKTLLSHLKSALVSAEGLAEREENPERRDKSVCQGLEHLIHNLKVWF